MSLACMPLLLNYHLVKEDILLKQSKQFQIMKIKIWLVYYKILMFLLFGALNLSDLLSSLLRYFPLFHDPKWFTYSIGIIPED